MHFMFIPRMKQQQLGTGSDNAVEAPGDERIQTDVDSSQKAGTDVSESDKSISDAVCQRSDTLYPIPRYAIPTRRPPGTPAVYPRTDNPLVDVQPSSRPVRERRKPQWMTSNDWVLAQQHPVPSSRIQFPVLQYYWYPYT